MKNTIYKYFFYEFLRYFTTTLFALAVIVWTVQAVNLLDLVIEDGHAFAVYFFYSFLTLSKILTKLIPLCFLIAIAFTIFKLEKDNELIVLWTSGLNKINLVNQIFRLSLLIMFFQLFMTSIVNPNLLNYSRTILKNSELQFVPSLLKEKQFNDTVEGLTIFVGKKDRNSNYENIFIRDEGKILSKVGALSSTIFAKSGYVSRDEKSLILKNGNIQKLKEDGNVNIVNFERTELILSGIATKSISEPKMQETPTLQILRCLKESKESHNCDTSKKTKMDIKIELNKRLGMPFFIPLIALVCCFLLASRKDKRFFAFKRYIYLFLGIIILAGAEVMVRYSGISWSYTSVYYSVPIIFFPIFYFILIRTFKYENLS